MGYSSKWRRMAPLGGKWSNVAVESHGGAVWRVMLSGGGGGGGGGDPFVFLIQKITLYILQAVDLGARWHRNITPNEPENK